MGPVDYSMDTIASDRMYVLIFYVPKSHLEEVLQAVFLSGAGKIGDYSGCCWYTKGVGRFTPGPKATPYLGQVNQPSQVEEYRVDIRFPLEALDAVVAALKLAHPYEQPVYHIFQTLEGV